MNTPSQKQYFDAHHHHEADENDVFGFWMYLLTDCVLFACLFATFVVLKDNTFGGPALKTFIDLPYVLGETMFLLFSNLTYGFAMLCMYRKKHRRTIGWLIVTLILGLGFVLMEVNEFIHMVKEGHSWASSGSLTGFFSLVGTHGLHVSVGLLWMLITIFQLYIFKTDRHMQRRLTYLGIFWNFLDIVWIFVFTVVYLMGVI